jgi:hypothetical protein
MTCRCKGSPWEHGVCGHFPPRNVRASPLSRLVCDYVMRIPLHIFTAQIHRNILRPWRPPHSTVRGAGTQGRVRLYSAGFCIQESRLCGRHNAFPALILNKTVSIDTMYGREKSLPVY